MDSAPPKKKRWRWALGAVALLLIAAALLVVFWHRLPYQQAVSAQLKKQLESYGLEVSSLEVKSLSQSAARIEDITLGSDGDFNIAAAEANYSLTSGGEIKLHHLQVNDLRAQLENTQGTLNVRGLEPLMKAQPETSSPSLLFDAAEIAKMAPESLTIKDATLSLKDPAFQGSLTLNAEFLAAPAPSLHLQSKALEAHADKMDIATGAAEVKAMLDATTKKWAGTFSLKDVAVSGAEPAIPALQIKGDFTLSEKTLKLSLRANNTEKTHLAALRLSLPLSKPRAGKLVVESLAFPWGGGVISLKDVTIALAFDAPIEITAHLEKVKLAELLATIGEEGISGTGEVSGALPINYAPDGTITLKEGAISSLEAGTITVAPSLLPRENAELAVARTALENFHYTRLAIRVSSNAENKSVIGLSLQGNNPDAFEGRPIHLNVNLSGDVLPLIQQSLLPINDVKQLLTLQESQ